MTLLLLTDLEEHPELFRFNGPIQEERVNLWIQDVGLVVPADLRYLWITLGGGQLFESETLLEPRIGDDDIAVQNEFLESVGFPHGLYAFHTGCALSAIDEERGDIAVLDVGSLTVRDRYLKFDQWYRAVIRQEYAARYGLSVA